MQNFLKRYDVLWTVVIFLLMIPLIRFEAFSLIEDELLSWRHLLRWQIADTQATTFSSDSIILVRTDEAFYSEYGGFPLRRADYGRLAKYLAELDAAVVAIDALFDYPNAYGEDPETAAMFAEAGNVLLVSKGLIDTDGRRTLGLTYPVASLREVSRSGYSNIASQSRVRTRISRLRVFPEMTRRQDGWPFAVMALAMYKGVEPVLEDGRLIIGDIDVELHRGLDLFIDFPELPGATRFLSEHYGFSAMDVLRMPDMRPDEVRDLRLDVAGKIVVVGDTSQAANDIFDTPVGQVYGAEIIANTIHTLLQGAPIRPPPFFIEILALLAFCALVLATSLIRTAPTRVLATLLLFGGYLTAGILVYGLLGVAMAMTYSLLAGLMGVLLISLRFYLASDESLGLAVRESAESNRMLALAMQGQGQLDMAFDKFRKIPLDAGVADLVYNLALDFERKRQFNKAVSVYNYLLGWKADYRDVNERKKHAQAAEDNPMKGSGGTLMLTTGGTEKPMLGRYEVEKELGQGAMGVVYLGRDPKINRVVAIKTLSLATEYEGDALKEVKDRFFREAQSAGRLNHPNIVAIYDAGEEHDLAYIAMEFLKGKDLSDKTDPEHLLPLPVVVDLMIQCAEALDYAHRENVVHRDIKPGNIMYDSETGKATLTDFGIARITDASRTRTGTVLGTPNYMSPEQALGEHVDGRSDLFSLGVVLYQMSTGFLPFQAESMATLLYKIVNEKHPDPAVYRPELPTGLRKIVHNALGKNPDRRYQTGAKFAAHLKVLRDRLASERRQA
ncbi:MAG: protein kinase [Gammaproteobacteria bacterium]|nr:protein kinase [Gammaproteobacteria bacterium]